MPGCSAYRAPPWAPRSLDARNQEETDACVIIHMSSGDELVVLICLLVLFIIPPNRCLPALSTPLHPSHWIAAIAPVPRYPAQIVCETRQHAMQAQPRAASCPPHWIAAIVPTPRCRAWDRIVCEIQGREEVRAASVSVWDRVRHSSPDVPRGGAGASAGGRGKGGRGSVRQARGGEEAMRSALFANPASTTSSVARILPPIRLYTSGTMMAGGRFDVTPQASSTIAVLPVFSVFPLPTASPRPGRALDKQIWILTHINIRPDAAAGDVERLRTAIMHGRQHVTRTKDRPVPTSDRCEAVEEGNRRCAPSQSLDNIINVVRKPQRLRGPRPDEERGGIGEGNAHVHPKDRTLAHDMRGGQMRQRTGEGGLRIETGDEQPGNVCRVVGLADKDMRSTHSESTLLAHARCVGDSDSRRKWSASLSRMLIPSQQPLERFRRATRAALRDSNCALGTHAGNQATILRRKRRVLPGAMRPAFTPAHC
ncbi:hypothetical protein DFH06DRAFT_1123966 [Mycena polygramma]|nr:hypothetical protein DFH06DRAFT_1123966 [Mycena polygramma]